MELLDSPPPWAATEERFADPASAPAPVVDAAGIARSKTVPSRRVAQMEGEGEGEGGGNANGRVGPRSASMAQQASYQSVNSVGSAFSSGSEVEAWLSLPPEERAKRLQVKPKNEREDLAHERQINHDLVDFFAAPPPGPDDHSLGAKSSRQDRRQSVQSTATGHSQAPSTMTTNGVAKKKSGGFLGFMRSKDKAPPPSQPAQPQRQQAQPASQPQQPPSAPHTPETDGWPTYAKGRRSSSSEPTRKPTKYKTEVDPAKAQAAAARAAALAGGYSPAMGSAASAAYSPPQPRRASHARSESVRSEAVSPMTGAVQLPSAVPEVDAATAAGAFAGGRRMAGPPKTPADFDPNQRSETPVTDGGREVPALPPLVHGLGISEESPVVVVAAMAERAERAERAGSEASVSDAGSKKMRRKGAGIVIGPRTVASGVVAAEGEAQAEAAPVAQQEEVQTPDQARLSVPNGLIDTTSATSGSPYVDAPSSAVESDVEDNLEPAPHKAHLQPAAPIDPPTDRALTSTPPPRPLSRAERVGSPTPSSLRSPSRASLLSPPRTGMNASASPGSAGAGGGKKPEVSLTGTLLALRVGMVSARTAEECLALLDQMLWHSTNEERGRVGEEGGEEEKLVTPVGEETPGVGEGEVAKEAEAAAPADVDASAESEAATEVADTTADTNEATAGPEEAALFEYFLGGSAGLPPKPAAAAAAVDEPAAPASAPATESLGHSLPSDEAASAGLTAADEEETPQVVISVDARDTVFAAPGAGAEGQAESEGSRSVTPVPPGGFAQA